MRHFINTQDWTIEELQALIGEAAKLKLRPVQPLLQGKTLALLFLNPSLRTRASFQIGAAQLGATAIVLEPGNGVWGIEFDSGRVMDGKAEEHTSRSPRCCRATAISSGCERFPASRTGNTTATTR